MASDVRADVMPSCFPGERLYDDDFMPEQNDAWFAGVAEDHLDPNHIGGGRYASHVLNRMHGYSGLPARRFGHMPDISSAYGGGLEPVIGQSGRIIVRARCFSCCRSLGSIQRREAVCAS
ncbi:hypothetical protein [Thauera sinica]|uniref:Uncharacterized protein n=1 Tax=Thauera sinica TaxID=2665146 RepID=A0ABW1AN83_9RHOO|nr:hypothetical protein [Thauera sp. K11]ATE60527.1 hypothetical protein CCZ27_11735 [Thauera sp. K11]